MSSIFEIIHEFLIMNLSMHTVPWRIEWNHGWIPKNGFTYEIIDYLKLSKCLFQVQKNYLQLALWHPKNWNDFFFAGSSLPALMLLQGCCSLTTGSGCCAAATADVCCGSLEGWGPGEPEDMESLSLEAHDRWILLRFCWHHLVSSSFYSSWHVRFFRIESSQVIETVWILVAMSLHCSIRSKKQ